MFIVFLEFTANKAQAGQWMDGHKAWLKRGFDDDPFVAENVVTAEIHELDPGRADPRLSFLVS